MRFNIAEYVFSLLPEPRTKEQYIDDCKAGMDHIFEGVAEVRFSHAVFLVTHSKLYYIFEVEVEDKVLFNRMKLTDERFVKLLDGWRGCYEKYLHDKDNEKKQIDVFNDF